MEFSHFSRVACKQGRSLRRIDDVKSLWHEMPVVREMEPSEISIGCVVDALVSTDALDDAVRRRVQRDSAGVVEAAGDQVRRRHHEEALV